MAELKPDDPFYAIGFTQEDILNGVNIRTLNLSGENFKAMASLHTQFGPLANAAQRGLVVEKLIEVYFFERFSLLDEDDTFEQQFGNKYQVVEYYSETALTLSRRFGIQLPPVIGKITRAELPESLGTSMRLKSYLPAEAFGAGAR
jgi:hypothetical protein